jgi:hypothetical protein
MFLGLIADYFAVVCNYLYCPLGVVFPFFFLDLHNSKDAPRFEFGNRLMMLVGLLLSYCKDMLGFLRIRIPRFEPDREVNKWFPI